MTDRLSIDEINSDQLDELYDALDGAYRERAHLVALLAAMTDGAVIAPAPDVDEPGWQIAYLTVGKWQASWHISPRDADLFRGVEHVAVDDPRAQWDGHTTDQKYTRIRNHTRVREMNRRLGGRAQQPASTAPLAAGLPLVQGRCPACGRASLFLGNGGHVTCSIIDCPNPSAADDLLHGEQQPGSLRDEITALRDDLRGITGARWIADMVDKILNPPAQAATEAKADRLLPDGTLDYDSPPPPLEIPGTPLRTAVSLHARSSTPTPCPACRRADQAGLAPDEQHAGCVKEQPRAAVAPTRMPEIDRSLAARPGGDEGAVTPGPVLEGW